MDPGCRRGDAQWFMILKYSTFPSMNLGTAMMFRFVSKPMSAGALIPVISFVTTVSDTI
jgi:hypothetical protein